MATFLDLLSILSLILFVSCKGAIGSGKSGSEIDNTQSSIIGAWSQFGCDKKSENEYWFEIEKFNPDGTYIISLATYNDENCSALETSVTHFFTFEQTSDHIQMHHSSSEVILNTSTIVEQANTGTEGSDGPLCGDSDWQIGVAKNIKGKTCNNLGYFTIGGTPYSQYELEYYFDEDILYLNDCIDGKCFLGYFKLPF